MRWLALPIVLVLAGCMATVEQPQPEPRPEPQQTQQRSTPQWSYTPTAADEQRFAAVIRRMEPVAERECRTRSPNIDCDFKIVVDDRPNQPPNAFQTLDRNGRPILAFNLALIASVRNQDELAFVVGHEAAHHIAGHIPKSQQNAQAAAILLGGLAAITGASSAGVSDAANLGGMLGARSYSKEFELEADALGTVITKRAGYDPLRGAEFFNQIPDPGDRFLGTHPPNAQRIETVRRVNAQL